jgi:delta1-piperideine-2-carboxylate reductase
MAIRNSHHFGCLWADVEAFAEVGLVALTFVNSRSRIVAPGARTKVLGTNPMAFAAPRRSGPPLVWDQASSVMAHGDVLIAAREGRRLPPGCGVDRHGTPTNDPAAVIDGGALLPFAAHKGMLIAMLVEILAAAVTGGRFGFEDESMHYPGAQTSNAGQLIILLDPVRMGADDFEARIDSLLEAIMDAGTERLPGQRRFEQRRKAQESGISVPRETHERLLALVSEAPHVT